MRLPINITPGKWRCGFCKFFLVWIIKLGFIVESDVGRDGIRNRIAGSNEDAVLKYFLKTEYVYFLDVSIKTVCSEISSIK